MKTAMGMLGVAVVTAAITWMIAIWSRDETYAGIIWAKCPQLILHQSGSEVAHIETLEGGYIPIRPRAPK